VQGVALVGDRQFFSAEGTCLAATRGAVGPEQAPDETEADFDGDCDVDDFAIFAANFTGPL